MTDENRLAIIYAIMNRLGYCRFDMTTINGKLVSYDLDSLDLKEFNGAYYFGGLNFQYNSVTDFFTINILQFSGYDAPADFFEAMMMDDNHIIYDNICEVSITIDNESIQIGDDEFSLLDPESINKIEDHIVKITNEAKDKK